MPSSVATQVNTFPRIITNKKHKNYFKLLACEEVGVAQAVRPSSSVGTRVIIIILFTQLLFVTRRLVQWSPEGGVSDGFSKSCPSDLYAVRSVCLICMLSDLSLELGTFCRKRVIRFYLYEYKYLKRSRESFFFFEKTVLQ